MTFWTSGSGGSPGAFPIIFHSGIPKHCAIQFQNTRRQALEVEFEFGFSAGLLHFPAITRWPLTTVVPASVSGWPKAHAVNLQVASVVPLSAGSRRLFSKDFAIAPAEIPAGARNPINETGALTVI